MKRGSKTGYNWYRGVDGEVWGCQPTAGMRYVRGPMSALSVASDGKEEGGGLAACGSYENCSVLKQAACNKAQANMLQSHRHTLFFLPLILHKTEPQTRTTWV